MKLAAGMSAGLWLAAATAGSCCLAATEASAQEVYFSPDGGCTEAVVRELGGARSTVHVQAYGFTSVPIARALVAARRRGVDVEVILDRSNRTARYSAADFLVHHGIVPRIDSAHAIAHNKVMIIDDRVVLTGSFNFTSAAEAHNAENLLVVRGEKLAAAYLRNWEIHARHSSFFDRDELSQARQAGNPLAATEGRH